jgi:hypothetical protein
VAQPVFGSTGPASSGPDAGRPIDPTVVQSRYNDPYPGGAYPGAGGSGTGGPGGPGDEAGPPKNPFNGPHRNQWIIGTAVVVALIIAGVAYGLTRSGSGTPGSASQTTTVPTTIPTTTATPTTAAPTTTTPPTTAPPSTTVATTTTIAPTTTTAPPPDPQTALNAIVAGFAPNYATSGVVSQGGALWAGVSHGTTGSPAIVDVYRYGSGGWLDQATVPLTADGGAGEVAAASQNTTPVTAASLTGSIDPDFVVVTEAASNLLTSVVSDAVGSWTAIPFDTPNGTAIAVPSATVVGNLIKAGFNNCVPDCADGTTNYIYFQYSNGVFQQVKG